jgi:hypothetical protein
MNDEDAKPSNSTLSLRLATFAPSAASGSSCAEEAGCLFGEFFRKLEV